MNTIEHPEFKFLCKAKGHPAVNISAERGADAACKAAEFWSQHGKMPASPALVSVRHSNGVVNRYTVAVSIKVCWQLFFPAPAGVNGKTQRRPATARTLKGTK